MNSQVCMQSLLIALVALTEPVAADEPRPFAGTKSIYHGFDRYDFEVDGQKCLVVTPKKVADGRPWIWLPVFM